MEKNPTNITVSQFYSLTLKMQFSYSSLTPEMTRSEIVVALVVCGDRLQETLNLVKSALIFQLKNPLRIIILAEDNLIQSLEEKVSMAIYLIFNP